MLTQEERQANVNKLSEAMANTGIGLDYAVLALAFADFTSALFHEMINTKEDVNQTLKYQDCIQEKYEKIVDVLNAEPRTKPAHDFITISRLIQSIAMTIMHMDENVISEEEQRGRDLIADIQIPE